MPKKALKPEQPDDLTPPNEVEPVRIGSAQFDNKGRAHLIPLRHGTFRLPDRQDVPGIGNTMAFAGTFDVETGMIEGDRKPGYGAYGCHISQVRFVRWDD